MFSIQGYRQNESRFSDPVTHRRSRSASKSEATGETFLCRAVERHATTPLLALASLDKTYEEQQCFGHARLQAEPTSFCHYSAIDIFDFRLAASQHVAQHGWLVLPVMYEGGVEQTVHAR
jgi:hypothetical protein